MPRNEAKNDSEKVTTVLENLQVMYIFMIFNIGKSFMYAFIGTDGSSIHFPDVCILYVHYVSRKFQKH